MDFLFTFTVSTSIGHISKSNTEHFSLLVIKSRGVWTQLNLSASHNRGVMIMLNCVAVGSPHVTHRSLGMPLNVKYEWNLNAEAS